MSRDDLDKMMKDYREKALASRTRFQRFVDTFGLIPITVYFFLMVALVVTAGYGLADTETLLKLLLGGIVNPLNSTFLADLQRAILINMWFINPFQALWDGAIYTAGFISVLVGAILFVVYFISRAVAYREVFYLDLGFLAFFLLGLVLMVVAHNLFDIFYYYYPGTVVYTLLAIPAIITTAAKKPFTFQYVQRIFPKEIKETDVYKQIHYAIGAVWSVIFVVNAVIGYITYYVPIGWLWGALFITPAFFLLFGWAFMTHFSGWYARRALKAPLEKSKAPIRRLTRIVGAGLILFGLLGFLYGFLHTSSTGGTLNIVEGFLISPVIGLDEAVLITGAAQISSIVVLLETIVPIILMVAGVGVILGSKWGWYLAIGGLVFYIGLAWLGWVFPPNIGIMDWIGTLSYFYSALALYMPYEPFFFAAVLLSGTSAVFLCYLFPKRDQYIL
jgi:hypothetical protein